MFQERQEIAVLKPYLTLTDLEPHFKCVILRGPTIWPPSCNQLSRAAASHLACRNRSHCSNGLHGRIALGIGTFDQHSCYRNQRCHYARRPSRNCSNQRNGGEVRRLVDIHARLELCVRDGAKRGFIGRRGYCSAQGYGSGILGAEHAFHAASRLSLNASEDWGPGRLARFRARRRMDAV